MQDKERVIFKRCRCEVLDAYRSYAAQVRLNQGFRGMGVNIVQEKAARLTGHLRTLKRLGQELCLS